MGWPIPSLCDEHLIYRFRGLATVLDIGDGSLTVKDHVTLNG